MVAPVHFRAWASGVGRPHGEALGLQGCLLAGAGNVGSSTESDSNKGPGPGQSDSWGVGWGVARK